MTKIYFDAGHGGKDPGAVKYVVERDVAIQVVNHAVTYLKNNYICEVYKDITDDSTHNISARANKWGADLFVSVHFNAGKGDGYEALVYGLANLQLGKTFEKYVKAIGQNSRGVKYRPDLNVLRLTNMPAILNEIAFVDNKKDIADWDEPQELQEMGKALALACADHLNLKKKSTKPIKPTKPNSSKEFKVKVIVDKLNIRSTPEVKSDNVVDTIEDKGVYTITETSKDGTWGYLKSKVGWIRIKPQYVKKV